MKVLITGANRGLGFELARAGAAKGYTVFAGVRSGSSAAQLEKLQEEYPGLVHIVALDVVDETSVAQAAEEVRQHAGAVDAVINNAGVLLGRHDTVEALNIDEVRATLDVNLLGPIIVVKHFLPLLRESKQPAIINVSSDAGSLTNSYGGNYAYCISKAGLNMFTEQINKYLAGSEAAVYSVHPGWIKTDMGGEQAPGDPAETSAGIWALIERKVKGPGPFVYVDFRGQAMKI